MTVHGESAPPPEAGQERHHLGPWIRSLKHFWRRTLEQSTARQSAVRHGVRWCEARQRCPGRTAEGWRTALVHTEGERHLCGTHVASEPPRHGVSLGEHVCLLASTGRGNGRWDRRELEMPQDPRDHGLLGDDSHEP